MKAKDMRAGRLYRLSDGEIVVFSAIGATGMFIVHPPGEPDMQSSSALHPDTEITEASKERDEGCFGGSPGAM